MYQAWLYIHDSLQQQQQRVPLLGDYKQFSKEMHIHC